MQLSKKKIKEAIEQCHPEMTTIPHDVHKMLKSDGESQINVGYMFSKEAISSRILLQYYLSHVIY